MKQFANLFLQLDRTNKTKEKLSLLSQYFSEAPESDRIWALALFTGRRPPRRIKTTQMQQWAMAEAGIPEWLFFESYTSVGDLSETISLVLPEGSGCSDTTLAGWFSSFVSLKDVAEEEKRLMITEAWKQLTRYEIFVFNKLLMGSFRIGVSQTLVIRAIADLHQLDAAAVTHRLMGHWDPYNTTYTDLILAENAGDTASRPYPFYLAYAVENTPDELGDPGDWLAEWKWDGIRGQLILREGALYIWSRGEELVTDKFPELHDFTTLLPDNTVLDGEIICLHHEADNDKGWHPMPFNVLQTRMGRKTISKKTLQDAPVGFVAYDILEYNGEDIRQTPQQERRSILESIYRSAAKHNAFRLSPGVSFDSWEQLADMHTRSREHGAEGFMLKRKNSPYLTGRKKGDWWKWKVNPLSADAVMVYAQKGHGRRAELYTDYTFAVWDGDKLVPFAKAYSGLTDKEIQEVDKFIKQNTLEKFGPVRTVKPELVFEIGFEGINTSSRHKSGIAVRFPRILRMRRDKTAAEADTLDNLKQLLALYS